MDIREMSIGERIQYRINGIVAGLIIILATWISIYISKNSEWAIFYAAGLLFVFFGIVALLIEWHLANRDLKSLKQG